jgi:hypothetical protein
MDSFPPLDLFKAEGNEEAARMRCSARAAHRVEAQLGPCRSIRKARKSKNISLHYFCWTRSRIRFKACTGDIGGEEKPTLEVFGNKEMHGGITSNIR